MSKRARPFKSEGVAIIKRLGLTISLAEHRAIVFLERRGYGFGAHFGIKNARDAARVVRSGKRWLDIKVKPRKAVR